MVKIVAIWGWWVSIKWDPIKTQLIDKKILSLSKNKKPKVLLITNASNDNELFASLFKKYYEDLWSKVDFLFLVKEKYSFEEMEEKILSTDIIYVSWWNTLKMMTLWRKLWVDKLLKKALDKNIILSWVSAWAICWFKYWNSDSRKFTSDSDKLIKVTWLNFVNWFMCPHYSSEQNRIDSLKNMLQKSSLVWIALDDSTAILIDDDNYEILKSNEESKSYKIFWKWWKYYKSEINWKWKVKDLIKK